MIIDERSEALNIINGDNLESKDMWKKIYLICKYWCSIGMDRVQIQDEVNAFLSKKYKKYNKVKMADKLDEVIKNVTKNKKHMIIVEKIVFTKPEIEVIDNLPSNPLKKLAFVILYHAKLTKEMYMVEEEQDIWLNDGVNKYCNLAGIYNKKEDKLILMSKLQDFGLLKISKSLREFMYKVNYIKKGEICFEINQIIDEKDLLLNYLKYKGENIKECDECGRLIKINHKNNKICSKCSKQRQLEHQKKAMKKLRK